MLPLLILAFEPLLFARREALPTLVVLPHPVLFIGRQIPPAFVAFVDRTATLFRFAFILPIVAQRVVALPGAHITPFLSQCANRHGRRDTGDSEQDNEASSAAH